MATTPTTVGTPTADFVTTTLNGALSAGATSATIGTGLTLPASNGIIVVDYDSSTAVGADNGPETIKYSTYTSGTGALASLTRGQQGTTGVSHANGASVQSAPSTAHLNNIKDVMENGAWTSFTASPVGFSSTTTDSTFYIQLGKLVFCSIFFQGTSNATNLTFTLPVAAKKTIEESTSFSAIDNGARTGPGRVELTAASTTANCVRDTAGNAWTGSGTKMFQGSFFYEAN